jgi:putative spermidine/putrescine transport system substrate-binding protein
MTITLARCVVLVTTALAIAIASRAMADEQIAVTTYGVWANEMKACWLDPFTKATGITVIADPGASGPNLAKLIQEKAAPAHDAAWIDGGVSEQALDKGVIDNIDPKAVPNIAGLAPQAIHKTKDGRIFALSTGMYVTAIEYSTKSVKNPPTSWWDLWAPEYENRVEFPTPAMGNFAPLFMYLNKQLGGTSSNFAPIVAKLKTLKAYAFYDAGGILNAALQNDEVSLAPFFGNQAWILSDKGLAMQSVVPKEGTVAGDIRIHLVKDSKHKIAGEKFINFVISPEALSCMAEKTYLGPPLKSPVLPEKVKARMPWGATGSVNDLQFPDWNEVNAKQGEILEIWNRKIIAR